MKQESEYIVGKPAARAELAALAKQALSVQYACNLMGVTSGYHRALCRLSSVLQELGEPCGTDAVAQHPISKLWADKVADLAGTQAYGATAVDYETVFRLQAVEGVSSGS